jgi:hypothetical protein
MDGIRIGALKPKSYKGRGRHRVPRKVSAGKPYLLDLKIDVGQPFVTARTSSGHEITIARRVRIGNGEIILIPQARMWNNETMGTMRDEPFNETGRGAFTFQMRLIDWLSKRPPVADLGNGEAFNHSVEFGSGDVTGAGDGEGFKTGGDSASHLVKAN